MDNNGSSAALAGMAGGSMQPVAQMNVAGAQMGPTPPATLTNRFPLLKPIQEVPAPVIPSGGLPGMIGMGGAARPAISQSEG